MGTARQDYDRQPEVQEGRRFVLDQLEAAERGAMRAAQAHTMSYDDAPTAIEAQYEVDDY